MTVVSVVYCNWLGAVYSNSITLALRKLSQNFALPAIGRHANNKTTINHRGNITNQICFV